MDEPPFHYEPKCSTLGCGRPAVYKIAAPWSDGTSHELKNYGLACEVHRTERLAQARASRAGLHLAEGETVGPVGVYQLRPGRRDRDLIRLPD